MLQLLRVLTCYLCSDELYCPKVHLALRIGGQFWLGFDAMAHPHTHTEGANPSEGLQDVCLPFLYKLKE